VIGARAERICIEHLPFAGVAPSTLTRRLWAQVNHSPSFTVDTPLDLAIKQELISDTIELVRTRCNPGNTPEPPAGGASYLACLTARAVMLVCAAAGGHRPQGDQKAQGGGADGCTRAAVRRCQGGPCTGAWRCV
jgi:hypothetical protein